jgi:hypothetical protein
MRDLHGTKTVLLGPQRHEPTVRAALERLGLGAGPVAAITAGWEEREAEDLELGEHLARPVVNLGLHERAEQVFHGDPGLYEALRQRRDRMRELQRLYRVRLRYLAPAADELLRRQGPDDLLEPERQAALDQLRDLDEHHLGRVRGLEEDLREQQGLATRPDLEAHRRDLARQIAGTRALLIAGGHVGILYNRLWLFGVLDLVPPTLPIVAWSAGAMVLAERVVLFHDAPPQGRGWAEVFGPGLGLCRGVVPLPHASRRLHLDDPVRVQMLSRRFPDALCVALDEGSELVWDGQVWTGSATTRRLGRRGALQPVGAAEEPGR